VNVDGIIDPDTRLQILERRMAFDDDPTKFLKDWEDADHNVSDDITRAQNILSDVVISHDLLRKIVDMCVSLGVDGHRGDISLVKASRTLAAYNNRKNVILSDIRTTAPMVLMHRMRKTPFSDAKLDNTVIDRLLNVQ